MSGEPIVTIDYGDQCLPDRFWDKVYPCPITGCWIWGAACHDTLPYGIWREDGRTSRAHVSAYLAAGGELTPDKPFVLHSCDQAACVWPVHLRAGTQMENMEDARKRKRLRLGRRTSLVVADVVQIRERYAANESCASIGRAYGLSKAAISGIVRGDRWAEADGPLTFGRHLGTPSPTRERPTCSAGHLLTGDNLRLKANTACRSGYERRCRECERRRSIENNDRRRGVARKRALTSGE